MGLLRGLISGDWRVIGDKVRPARLDESTHTLTTISYSHHEIHAGSNYFVTYSVASIGALTTPDDAMTLTFRTPNTTKWLHFTFKGSGPAGALLKLVEAPTGGLATPTGTLSVYNSNRNLEATKPSTILSYTASTAAKVDYDSTLGTGGVVLWSQYLEGAGGPQSSGASSSLRDEIVLKQNTAYQCSLYSTTTEPATLHLDWYEHTDRN